MAAGRLDLATAEAVTAHVETCPECRQKLEQFRRTWDVMGSWGVESPRRLSEPEVLVGRARAPRTIRLPAPKAMFRVAASILVASILGYAGGWLIHKPVEAAAPADTPTYLSLLGSHAGDGLSSLVLSYESPSGKGG